MSMRRFVGAVASFALVAAIATGTAFGGDGEGQHHRGHHHHQKPPVNVVTLSISSDAPSYVLGQPGPSLSGTLYDNGVPITGAGNPIYVHGFGGFGCMGPSNSSLTYTFANGNYGPDGPWPITIAGNYSFMSTYYTVSSPCVNVVVTTKPVVVRVAGSAPYCSSVDPAGTYDAIGAKSGPASIHWITPDLFNTYINVFNKNGHYNAATNSATYTNDPAWTTGFIASFWPGHGFTCAKGTPNNNWYNTAGETTTSGHAQAVRDSGATAPDALGTMQVSGPGYLPGVTFP